jgi:hypothetical protein
MGTEPSLWLPTTMPSTSAPLPKTLAKVTDSGTLASGPSTLYIPCPSPRTATKPRSSALRRPTLTRKCVKIVPLTKVFSSKQPSPSLSFTTPSSCDHPLPEEPPPPYQLRVANPAPASERVSEYDYGYDHNMHGRGAASATAMSSSSRFTAASVEAIRAPDSPVPTFPSPKLSTESVFGGSTQSFASVSDLEPAPANNTTIPEPRYIRTHRNSAARGGAGLALKRKETIGFARRVTLSSSGYHGMKSAVLSAPKNYRS